MTTKYQKVVLVTGGAGFIGSNYLNVMVTRYPHYRFINLDSLTYASNLKNVHVAEAPNYAFVEADIRNAPALEAIWQNYSPTDVIHFAAESHVDNSIATPRIFVETNVLGTQNLLELSRTRGIKRFHHISTDEVYGSLAPDAPPTDESAPLFPNSPYSASKAGADHLVRSYHKTFGLDTVTTRASNNYGPHQHPEKLIPHFIKKLLSGEKVPLYGTGKNVRDWIYVGDHVEGIDATFHKGAGGEVYNLGGGNELKNIDITKKLLALTGRDEDAITYVADRPGHDLRYALDCSKAVRKLDWKPAKSFEEGLAETVEFYRSNPR